MFPINSIVDPERFIPDPDPVTNLLSSGSGFNTYYLSIFGKKPLNNKCNQKEESSIFKSFLQSYSTQSPELTGLKLEM